MDANNLPTSIETTPPAWYAEWAESFLAAEAAGFILYGDIEGYTPAGADVRKWLTYQLGSRREVVAVYSLAEGIRLYDPEGSTPIGPDERDTDDQGRPLGEDPRPVMIRRERALQLVGLGGPPAADPVRAALAAAGSPGPQLDPFAAARSPQAAIALLGRLLRSEGRVAVLIDYANLIVPPSAVAGAGAMSAEDRAVLASLLTWAKDGEIDTADNPFFLLTRDLAELHPDVRAADSGLKAIELPLPDLGTRHAYVEGYLAKRAAAERAIDIDGLTTGEIARLTAGLSLRHIEDVLLLGARRGQVTRELLKSRKDAIIRQQFSEVAEMIEPLAGGFAALGGMAEFKRFAQREIIDPIRQGRPLDAAKAGLLVGPPGTGKSYGVRALAAELGFNAVQTGASKLLGGIVGESEKKMARFLAFAEALAPVVVFLDELDQSDFAQRGNGSGNPVASNMFSALLQAMSDETTRGKVIWLFASNRPDLIDPALKRFGRVDAVIPVLLPGEDERGAIIRAQAENQGAQLDAGVVGRMVAGTDKWSAGDLAALVRKARKMADGQPIDQATATEALGYLRPNSPQTWERFTLLAIEACSDAEYVPAEYRTWLADREALAARIAATAEAPAVPAAPPSTDGRRERKF